jgi:hypothetical protein
MGRAGRYTLTVRHGSRVERQQFESLEDAIDTASREADEIRAEGPLPKVSVPRDYEPSEQVHARLEISTGSLLRRRDAGVDLMGDGSLVPFRGAVRRVPLEAADGKSPFETLAEAIGGARE